MAETFGDTPEEFDLDAWLDQGSRPQVTVKVYRDWALMGELVKLEEQIKVADQEDDPSLDDVTAEELREQYQAVLDRLAESALEVTLQAITNEETRAIAAGIPEVEQTFRDQHGKEQTRWKPDQVAIGDALLAEATVSPRMTRDQVRAMRVKLGDGPTNALYQTAADLRATGKVLPSVPSSPGSSDDSRA
ncbi:hypothetical protein ABZ546_13945 [Brachybacterium paraconglomeratum]